MKKNVGVWQDLQDADYFNHHPCYRERDFNQDDAVRALQWLGPLRSDMKIAIVGCGYGRETVGLAPLVGHVWGIDVSPRILNDAVAYLAQRDVQNFTPVQAHDFEADIPHGLDAFFSYNVMQHLTRDLVRHYFTVLGERLTPDGGAVVQFLQSRKMTELEHDAPTQLVGEPSVSWSSWQLVEMVDSSGLALEEIRTRLINPNALWHWVIARKRR